MQSHLADITSIKGLPDQFPTHCVLELVQHGASIEVFLFRAVIGRVELD